MDWADLVTRGSAWLAIASYVAGEIADTDRRCSFSRSARALTSAGWVLLLAHALCSFHFHHGWSHTVAYVDTASQTAALTGLDWGGGLFINYGFLLFWLAEVVWRWAAPLGHAGRPGWITWTVRAVFLFMIVNGAVVFVQGGARWLGLILSLALVLRWSWPAWRK